MAGVSVYCGCREGGVGYIGGGIQRQQGEGVQGGGAGGGGVQGVGGWTGRGQGEHTAKCVQIYR